MKKEKKLVLHCYLSVIDFIKPCALGVKLAFVILSLGHYVFVSLVVKACF